jgi:uncharacterized protein YjbJ (UPF0337 family)
MDKDRIQGTGRKVTGKIKEGIGKLTGDKRQEGEGKAEKGEGKFQDTVGKAKDKLRDKL